MISRAGFTCSICSFHVLQARTLPPIGVGLIWMATFGASTFTAGVAPLALDKFGISGTLAVFGTVCAILVPVFDIILGDDEGKSPLEIVREYDNFKYYKPFVSINKIREALNQSETFEPNYKLVWTLVVYGVLPMSWVIYNLLNLEASA